MHAQLALLRRARSVFGLGCLVIEISYVQGFRKWNLEVLGKCLFGHDVSGASAQTPASRQSMMAQAANHLSTTALCVRCRQGKANTRNYRNRRPASYYLCGPRHGGRQKGMHQGQLLLYEGPYRIGHQPGVSHLIPTVLRHFYQPLSFPVLSCT